MQESGRERTYWLGVDVGASSVKVAAVAPTALGCERASGIDPAGCASGEGTDGTPAVEVLLTLRAPHRADPAGTLARLLREVDERLGLDRCQGVAATGCRAAGLLPRAHFVEDVPALTAGVRALYPQARCLVAIGAQSATFVNGLTGEGMPNFAVNDSCAAGTGSFFEDQMGRLGLAIEDYSRLVADAQTEPRLSGRCAVFAKTDVIHRQQEGVPVEDILLGLCHAMVRSYRTSIVRGMAVEAPLAVAGGVMLNQGVVAALREAFGLEGDALVGVDEAPTLQAVGAAVEAMHGTAGGSGADARELLNTVTFSFSSESESDKTAMDAPAEGTLVHLDPLPRVSLEEHVGWEVLPRPWPADGGDGRTCAALGIDVGSTSTNLVLVDAQGRLLDAQYLRTSGDPKAAVRKGLASIGQRLGDVIEVAAVATTGSGRVMLGDYVGADVVRDEITCQARGAAAADPQVDTVFEIGGQDSKFVALKDGQVVDFQMNKVCAAGTGSFVEEQAARLGIPLAEYGALALSSASPVDLGERCTVFVQTAIDAALAAGAGMADVAAGLALSIVRNYLRRVVAEKHVGSRVVLQGGVAYNPAIVAAFKAYYGDRLTVSPYFAVSGAVGAALLAWEELRAGAFERTSFKGWGLQGTGGARKAVDDDAVEANRAFLRAQDQMLLEGYDGTLDPAKKTVGIPFALMLHKLFPLANAYFKQLGFNVLLSPWTDEEIVALAQQTCRGEACYPVKLVHGHMEWLARAGVDYIFMPRMRTVRHIMSKVEHNWACPFMQCAPDLAAAALDLQARGVELIAPEFDMDFGQTALAGVLLEVGARLGFSPQEAGRAMLAGGTAMSRYVARSEAMGDELLASLPEGQRVLVLMTRQYGIADPQLNMGIPEALLAHGERVITVTNLHAHAVDVSPDYPHVYWPFGQHMVSAAKLIRRDPRLFAVYLTNHGCGPDAMMGHLIAEEMGDKPYLQIEVDEHASAVGVLTRVEAFLNALDHWQGTDESDLPIAVRRVEAQVARPDPALPAALPVYGAHGELAAAWMRGRGFADVREMHPTHAAIDLGRTRTTTKEYLTFAAELGMCLEAAGADDAVQLCLPATDGAEADGVYDRVVDSVLWREGNGGGRIFAPSFEGMPAELAPEEAAGALACALAGDVWYALPPQVREGWLHDARDAAQKGGLTCAWVAEHAREAAAEARAVRAGETAAEAYGSSPARIAGHTQGQAAPARAAAAEGTAFGRDGGAIAVVGEWPIVFDDVLSDGVWTQLEAAGRRVLRMPLAEYLWTLWRDARAALDGAAPSKARMFLDGPEKAAIPYVDAPADLTTDGLLGHLHGHAHTHAHGTGSGACGCAGCGTAAAGATGPVAGTPAVPSAIDVAAGFSVGAPAPQACACGGGCGCDDETPYGPRPAEATVKDSGQGARAKGVSACESTQQACAHENARAGAVDGSPLEPDVVAGASVRPASAKPDRDPRDPAALARTDAFLDEARAAIRSVHEALGMLSPFADDLDALLEAADARVGGFTGANARYRTAKEAAFAADVRVAGVVTAASLYENVEMRLAQLPAAQGAPVLRLSFDGVLDQANERRLRTFLYYL